MSELIAEARVLVTPDTTRFRSLLEAEIGAATSKPVTVPVTPVVVGGAAGEVAGARAATRSAAEVASSTNAASAARAQFARTEAVVAAAEKRAAVATTEAGAAQVRYSAALTSSAAAQKAYQLALTTTDEVLTLQSGLVVAITQQNEALALSNLEVARSAQVEAAGLTKAAAAQATNLGGVSKGAGSAAASLFGLRGATLAATAPFLAGAAAAITFAKALGLASEFNKQLSVLKVTSGATADELARVSDAAKQLGADVSLPGVSAIDAAQAMTELSKAGLSVQDSIAGARGVLQLATAAGIDNAAATELAASALNAFGLAGSDATKVADVLANSANDAQGSISDIGLALSQSAAAGRQAGLTLEQTVGILTEFARAGIKGSDAGTSLRVLLLRLINPSKQASEIIKQLGLHLRDATGNINLGFFDEFARKTANLTKAERDRDAAIIAGQDAFRGLAILSRAGGVELDAQIARLEKSGTAADLAAARMTGLAGAAENLKNQLSNVGLSIGQSLAPSLAEVVSGAATAVSALGSVVEEVKKLQKEAQRPIDFIINVIPGQAGGGTGGALATIKQDLIDIGTKPLPGLIFLSRLQKELAKEQANFNAVLAKGNLAKMVADLNKAGATAPELDKLVRKLQEIAKGTQGGSAETEAFRKSLEVFIKQLQELSAQPNIELPITLPKGLLDGTLGAQAAKSTASGFANQIKNEDFGFSGFVASVDFQDEGNQAGKLFSVGWAKALKDALKPATASALSGLDLAVAQAGGNQNQELAILRQQEARQQAFLAGLLKQPRTEKLVAQAHKEADLLKQTRDAIKRIIDERAADAKQISDAAKAAAATKQASGDRSFLQAQEDARTRQQRLITRAEDTPQLADDIRRQEQLRALIKKQIAGLRASTVDDQAKAAALRDLRKARDATTDEIQRLGVANKKQIAQQRADALAQIGENLSLRTQIAEARDAGTTVIVRRIDAEIANQLKVVARAKKAGKGVLEAILALEQLRQKKRDLLNQVKETTTGFSGFEFLQKTQGFASNLLGNLIPGFATGGLVGNVSPVQTARPVGDFGDVPVLPQIARPGDRGVRPVQVDTTNALLRQILAAVSGGRAQTPPETTFNRRWATATWDSL